MKASWVKSDILRLVISRGAVTSNDVASAIGGTVVNASVALSYYWRKGYLDREKVKGSHHEYKYFLGKNYDKAVEGEQSRWV